MVSETTTAQVCSMYMRTYAHFNLYMVYPCNPYFTLLFFFTSNMSSMEQGLIPSVCLSQAAAPTKEGEEPPSEVLESIKELSKVLEEEEDEDELVNDEDEDPELSE